MMPRMLGTDGADLHVAADHLDAGGVVAFPTETVYGLGACTAHYVALQRLYQLKQRPVDNPLIAHVLDTDQARGLVKRWPEIAECLADRFWPGPLTLILERDPDVPALATGGRDTIAVRSPAHDVARRFLSAFGRSISAPSANRSGHVSPTSARHVADEFADAGDLIVIDGGRCAVGIESTVLDLTSERPRILRPGSVTRRELCEFLPDLDVECAEAQGHSPGTSPRHYAPTTHATLVRTDMLDAAMIESTDPIVVLCFAGTHVPPPHHRIEMPEGAGDYARQLYSALRRADALMAHAIVIQMPPRSNDIWLAIHDRLQRATTECA